MLYISIILKIKNKKIIYIIIIFFQKKKIEGRSNPLPLARWSPNTIKLLLLLLLFIVTVSRSQSTSSRHPTIFSNLGNQTIFFFLYKNTSQQLPFFFPYTIKIIMIIIIIFFNLLLFLSRYGLTWKGEAFKDYLMPVSESVLQRRPIGNFTKESFVQILKMRWMPHTVRG
jgi:hypothetical protein